MRWLALFAFVVGGCYDPKLVEGNFNCGAAGACPSGFRCGPDALCHSLAFLASMDLSAQSSIGTGVLGQLDLTGQHGYLEVDSENGQVQLKATPSAATGTVYVAARAPGFERAPQTDGPTVGLWNFASLLVPDAVTVIPRSSNRSPVVFLCSDELSISGPIRFNTFGGIGGAPGMPGEARMTGKASGGQGSATPDGGGGGAGFAVDGDPGGNSGGAGGSQYGGADLIPLQMGSGGGGGGSGGIGGGGGGAIALVAKQLTVSGTIDVSANDGSAATGTAAAGGGGGGSGGSILLSGQTVTLGMGHMLVAHGGGGGAGVVGGGAGGKGSTGRIWIGKTPTLIGSGSVNSDPTAAVAAEPVSQFPR